MFQINKNENSVIIFAIDAVSKSKTNFHALKAKEFVTCHTFLGNFKKSKKLDALI